MEEEEESVQWIMTCFISAGNHWKKRNSIFKFISNGKGLDYRKNKFEILGTRLAIRQYIIIEKSIWRHEWLLLDDSTNHLFVRQRSIIILPICQITNHHATNSSSNVVLEYICISI